MQPVLREPLAFKGHQVLQVQLDLLEQRVLPELPEFKELVVQLAALVPSDLLALLDQQVLLV